MPGTQEKVYKILTRWQEMGGLEPAKELFWSCLNYDRVNQPFSVPEQLSSLLAESPVIFAASGEFRIYYLHLKSDKLRFSDERRIIKQIYRQSSPYGMFIFSNAGRDLWHLVNARLVATGDGSIRQVCRRITIGRDEKLRTAAERLAHMEVNTAGDPLALQHQCDQAFDVEAVTAAFYNGYKQVFESLQSLLQDQTGDSAWAHDYALQTLNRLMFLYFIQRKRWLGNNPEFIKEFWEAYKNSGQPPDTFFDNWLSVLFFEAFNNGFLGGREDYRRRFPENIRRELALAPYLNGGLFKRNELDQAYSVGIPDAYFGLLFDSFNGDVPGFLERYNFTVAEETPLDQEVAVDPEMIGKVYESLVNVSDEGIVEQDRRGEAGIFYTPRVEIDLMCRLSLADWLTNHLGGDYRELLYELVFAYEPEEKEEVDQAVAKANLWPDVDRLLQQVAVLDPACGSGSFLVGMLLVLDDLQVRAGKQLGRETTSYDRRKQIIGRSLYGVDVMPWAVHIAELRLWLQLVVDTEPDPVTAHLEPLLPNLSFKIRPGDSLLQEMGSINFALHRRKNLDISSPLKSRLTRLQNKKLEYFLGKGGFTESALKQEELLLFRDMLRERMKVLQEEIKKLACQIEPPLYRQARFEQMTEAEPVTTQSTLAPAFSEQLLRRKRFLEEELERLRQAIAVLQEESPFVWDLAFVEIFKGDKRGFDIVIGNPPYVRQEKIADPKGIYDKQTYKARLQETVAITWPRFFEYRESENKFRKLAGRSDLYVYFYLHGLSLLNEKGSFCFITSNSWLDVGYGKDLQEFLLRHGHVKLVVDNRAKRSFSQADVNTVIVLLGPADDRREDGLQKTARFAMFKVPFEEALSPVVFQEIAGTEEMTNRPEFRCIVRRQKELYDEGLELPEDGGDNELARSRAKYAGGKWGGQYLRAPDIYFTILEKGRGKLVRLGDIADVLTVSWSRQGQNSKLMIKKSYITNVEKTDVLKSPKDVTKIKLQRKDTSYWLKLEKWVKKQLVYVPMLWVDLRGDKHICHLCTEPIAFTHNFHGINLFDQSLNEVVCGLLNSSISWLFIEVLGRRGLGGGAVRVLVKDLKYHFPVITPSAFTPSEQQRLLIAFDQMSNREIKNIFDEIGLALCQQYSCNNPEHPYEFINSECVVLDSIRSDRRALDEAVFEVLGLTDEEKLAVYRAVVELVKDRLIKARSV